MAPFSAVAQAGQVRLAPGIEEIDITSALTYWPAVNANLPEALKHYRSGGYAKTFASRAAGPNDAPEAWAAVDLVNTSQADGRPPDRFVFTLNMPMVSGVRVFLVRSDGLTENLLDYSLFAPFDAAQHAVTRLRTPSFGLAAKEHATLLIRFQVGPVHNFRAVLHSRQNLAADSFVWGVEVTAFYAFVLACLVFFLGFHVAMRDALGLFFTGFFAAFLGFIAFFDGLLFRAVYPNHPEWQSAVGFFMLFAMPASGLLAAASILKRAGYAARAVRAIRWLAVLLAAGFAFALAEPGPPAALLAYGLIALMLVAIVYAQRAHDRSSAAGLVGTTFVTVLVLVGAVLVMVLMVTGIGSDWLLPGDALRVVFLLLLLAFMTHLSTNILVLRRRHAQAVRDRIGALEAEAERSRELLEAERNYSRARDLAALRQRQLATASHDLRQPLISLRMTFDTIAAEMEAGVKARLREAFDYLEALSRSYLDETIPDVGAETDDPPATDPGGDEPEPYSLSVVFQTIAQMFREEAVSRGLQLRVVDSSLETKVPPVVLMRILGNLVSNALKYTPEGKVLLGLRRAGAPCIHVIDTGPGLSREEAARYSEAYVKGAASTGHGLGLSVCHELAGTHGLRLEHRPGKRGTTYRLHLPANGASTP